MEEGLVLFIQTMSNTPYHERERTYYKIPIEYKRMDDEITTTKKHKEKSDRRKNECKEKIAKRRKLSETIHNSAYIAC